jgi:Uma2 family endonuclease
MAATLAERQRVDEETTKWVWPHPLNFEEFLDLYTGRKEIVELVDGMVVEHMAAQFEHESLIAWLLRALGDYVEERGLGIVLGSRTAVQITDYRGRIPDLLFIHETRREIIRQRACYGAPDLVIEVLSPNDRPSDRIALDADYRQLGVSEIVFVDPPHRRVLAIRKTGDIYRETAITDGPIVFETVSGFRLELEWLFGTDRPSVRSVITALLTSLDGSGSVPDNHSEG